MGIRLVNASAGTGKTYRVVQEYSEKCARDWKNRGDNLLLTFTNAAAEEMRERARARLLSAGMSEMEMGSLRIGTFDSLCLEIVREYGTDSPSLAGAGGRIPGRVVSIVESEAIEKRAFSEFWETLDFSGIPAEFLPIATDSGLFREIMGLLASRAVLPRKKEIERAVLGDQQALTEEALPATVPGEGKNGEPVQNKALKKYSSRVLGKKHLLGEDAWVPEKQDKKAGIEGEKAIPKNALLEAVAEDRGLLSSFLKEIYPKYVRFVAEKGLLTFPIARLLAFSTLAFSKKAREACGAGTVIVDEFQDTDSVQFKICLLLAKGELVLVGDEKQGIYGWRNAEIENILDFDARLERFKGELSSLDPSLDFSWTRDVDKTERLSTNWRSAPQILSFARHSFSADLGNNEPIPEEGALPIPEIFPSKKTVGLVGKIGYFRVEKGEGLAIWKIIGKFGLEPGKTAILSRNKETLERISEEFRELGLPYSIATKTDAYRSRAGILSLAWLRLLSDPNDLRALSVISEACGRPDFEIGVDPEFLLEIKKAKRLSEIPLLSARFHGLSGEEVSKALAISEAIEGMSSCLGMPIQEISMALEELVYENADCDYDYSVGSEAVTLSTIHGAKGLEWENVFVAGMRDGVFPNSEGGDWQSRKNDYFFSENGGLRLMKVFSESGQERANWKAGLLIACARENEGIEEEERLLYVALTRAKRRLFLSFMGEEREGSKYWNFLSRVAKERGYSEKAEELPESSGAFQFSGGTEAELPGELGELLDPVSEKVSVTEFIKALSEEPDKEECLGEDSTIRRKEFGTRVHSSAELLAKIGEGVDIGEELLKYPEGERGRAKTELLRIQEFLGKMMEKGCVEFLPEVPCLVPFGEKTLSGIIDLICVFEDRIVVVDYKTSADKKDRDKYVKQLEIYSKPLFEFFRLPIEGIIFWTFFGDVERVF